VDGVPNGCSDRGECWEPLRSPERGELNEDEWTGLDEYCGWKLSAAMGYRDGGIGTGGTDGREPSDGSRYGGLFGPSEEGEMSD
jgi:hypothetical protein